MSWRPGLGDETGRHVVLGDASWIEYRFGPADTCEIVNIEVDPRHRREGVGRKLLEKLFAEIGVRASRVYAITRADNEIAQQFWEACGFCASPLRRFYSGDHGVDAVLYVRDKGGPV